MALLDRESPPMREPAPVSADPGGARPQAGTTGLRRALVAIDVVALAAAWSVASLPVPGLGSGPVGLPRALLAVLTPTVGALVLLAAFRLYRARVCASRSAEMARLNGVVAGTGLIAAAVGLPAPRLAVGGILTFLLLHTARGFFDAWLRSERARGRFVRTVAIVAYGDEAARTIELLDNHPELGYRPCALAGDQMTAQRHGLPWLGDAASAAQRIASSGATGAIVVTSGMPSRAACEVIGDLLERGVHVQVSAGLWRIGHRRMTASPVGHEPFFYLEPPHPANRRRTAKRVLDLAVVTPLLVMLSPVLAAVALAVKAGDRGPVLFRQTRVGRDGRPFTILKFRTMVVDAEAQLARLQAGNLRQGPLFKVDDDPRQTKVGRFLRATSLDELPQLFNVFAGSMSMVGPRPALPSEVAAFDPELLRRHQVPPGVTGLWQVESRENASFYAYRRLDLFYVENWSVALDLVIMATTLPALGARFVRSLGGQAKIFNAEPVAPGQNRAA